MKKSELSKGSLILSLCCYVVLELCCIALTVVCFMMCWQLGLFAILFDGFIAVMIISTIQQMKGKKPIIKQEKTEFEPYSLPTKKSKLNSFWKAVGILTVLDELNERSEPPPPKKKSVLDSTFYDNDYLHTEEGHDVEDGYCMECDSAVEDIVE